MLVPFKGEALDQHRVSLMGLVAGVCILDQNLSTDHTVPSDGVACPSGFSRSVALSMALAFSR